MLLIPGLGSAYQHNQHARREDCLVVVLSTVDASETGALPTTRVRQTTPISSIRFAFSFALHNMLSLPSYRFCGSLRLSNEKNHEASFNSSKTSS